MGKTKVSRKKKIPEVEVTQNTKPQLVKEPPKPKPLTEEEKELAAVREKAMQEMNEATERYNREEVPKIIARITAAFKKLKKKATTEEVMKAFTDAVNDGRTDVSSW